jgi:hypothetical protein
MDPSVQRDLFERLTSRKFLFALVVVVLALIGWATHNLTYGEMIQAVLWSSGVFMGAEGIADAAGRLASKPTQPESLSPRLTAEVNVAPTTTIET